MSSSSGGEPSTTINQPPRVPPWAMPLFFAALTLFLFGDTLVVPHRVPATIESDLRCEYLYWREFGFDQIRAGHFALWNPYSFCGMPFFGDPQSAMLYPPNWLNLVLSPEKAAAWLIVAHFFMAAYFTGLWCRSRGLSVAAAAMAGTLYACSGPIISNLRPGHLPLLCSAAWAPLLLRCVDGLFENVLKTRWIMLGMAVVAMLATDGYPQFAYYLTLTVAIYVLLRLPWSAHRLRTITSVAILFAGGALLAAAQILASVQVAGESIRAGGLSYAAASAFSLPPENLLTLVAPVVFGGGAGLPYYARWNWWETCVFLGPAALGLAILGFAPFRRNWLLLVMPLTLMVLAMGAYTPVFPLLYYYLPGFANFRAATRFSLPAILFIALLAARGWDRLYTSETRRPWPVAAAMLALGLALALAAAWAASSPVHFDWLIDSLRSTGQVLNMPPDSRADQALVTRAAVLAYQQFSVALALTVLTAGLLALSGWKRKVFAASLLMVAIGHVIWFGVSQRVSSDRPAVFPPAWRAALSGVTPEQRVFEASGFLSEAGPADGLFNIDGYNPLVLGRTARFLAATQHIDPQMVGNRVIPQFLPNIYRILRCVLVTTYLPDGPIADLSNPLPRLLLMGDFRQAPDSDSALATVLEREFDPARTVVLESPPEPLPQPVARAGTVHLVKQTTDELEIEADLVAPQVLLVTDAYSQGWHVVPLEAGAQRTYQVLPADYCLRAIPLAAGHHHFRLEYRPQAVIVGMRISLAAVGAYVISLIWLCIARRSART